MCLKETYSIVHISKDLSDAFPIQNDLKQDALLPLLSNIPSGRSRKIRKDWT